MTVLLLEDHTIVREGIKLLLETDSGIDVVAEAPSLAAALETGPSPDVVIADLVLGDARGSDVVARLRARHPQSGILMLTMVDNPTDIRRAFNAGASGYLLKESAAEDLLEAVHRVASGEAYLHPSLGAALAATTSPAKTAHAATPESLSPREVQVLKLLALGYTNAEIAEALSVAVRTVEAHRSHLQEKLGMRSRAQLVRYAADIGLIDLRA